jgi:hypothetical protein
LSEHLPGYFRLTSFANLNLEGVSNTTRAVWGGGNSADGNAATNVMEYVTIATTGNTTDFGDLTQTRDNTCAMSSSNGGVQ